MSWLEVAGYLVIAGFFWLSYRGWCEDTRKIKRIDRVSRHD